MVLVYTKMANLITEKQKAAVRSDYLVRLSSIALFVPVSILGFFLLAYVVPYYISLNKKDMKIAEQFDAVLAAENKENTGENVSSIVFETADKMKALELYSGSNFIPSDYFNKIIENKNKNINITKLAFGVVNKTEKNFLVSGIARNRDGLVTFIEDLKIKGGFSGVELPISDFANDSDILFTLSIKLAL